MSLEASDTVLTLQRLPANVRRHEFHKPTREIVKKLSSYGCFYQSAGFYQMAETATLSACFYQMAETGALSAGFYQMAALYAGFYQMAGTSPVSPGFY